MRGDVISHLSREEGQVIMEQLMDVYLDETQYEKVRQFNHQPGSFDYQSWIDESIGRFRAKQSELEEKEVKIKTAKVALGPQKHSKLDMPKIPGSNEYFILDEIKKRIEFNKK